MKTNKQKYWSNRTFWLNLFKKYHPDNKETGDERKFIQIREQYEKCKNSFINITHYISLDESFNGCELFTPNNNKIIIPKKYYPTSPYIIDDNVEKLNVSVKISQQKDLTYTINNGNIIATKIIDITIFDILLGKLIEFDIFEEKICLTLPENFDIIKYPYKDIKNKGYPLKNNKGKKAKLRIQFNLVPLEMSEEDTKLLQQMRDNYGSKK